jgi:hypothetical protein
LDRHGVYIIYVAFVLMMREKNYGI